MTFTNYQEEGLRKYKRKEMKIELIEQRISFFGEIHRSYQSLIHLYNQKIDELEHIVIQYHLN